MRKAKGSYIFQTSIGLMCMAVLAILYTVILSTPEDVNSTDIVHSLMWYRIAGFSLLVSGWHWICRYITRKPPSEYLLSEEEGMGAEAKRRSHYRHLVNLRWKVALFCVFFETVAIQQLRFLAW